MVWITDWLPCGYENRSSRFVVWSPPILYQSKCTRVHTASQCESVQTIQQLKLNGKTAKSGYRVDIQGNLRSHWHWFSSVLRSAVKKKKSHRVVFHESTPLSMLLQGRNQKMKTRSKNYWEFHKKVAQKGFNRCGLKDYKKWLVWWDWPFKLKWQVARPPLHLGAMAQT